MGTYPAPMAANAGAPARGLFWALQIDLPGSPTLPATSIRLLDGAGVMIFLGTTWVGQDGDYGSWRGAADIEETVASQSTNVTVTLAPLSDAAQQQIAQPVSQGAPVTIYGGEYDLRTGQPICDPEMVFAGLIDLAHVSLDRNTRTLAIDVVSWVELLFTDSGAATLSSSWHNQFFPNETGFAFVDGVNRNVPWGAAGPRPDQATGANNYGVASDRGGGRTSLRF